MMPEGAIEAFKGFRTEGAGENMCLVNNIFVEQVIQMAVLRKLSDTEMEAYRAPYLEEGESRRPTLTWPRQIPIDGDPANVAKVLDLNCAWLKDSKIKKLFVRGEPGMMISGKVLEFCQSLPNLTEVSVVGAHYLQEDSSDKISKALKTWMS